jgi:RNA polymerase sigma factor (sigma-70 family)
LPGGGVVSAKPTALKPNSYRGDNAASLSARKGGKSMESRNNEERIRHNFDSFCKKVLKRRAIDLQRETKRRREHETNFSELSPRELASLYVTDDYFTDEYIFSVLGESVGVSDTDLANALNTLPANRREIVLMSYFFDMTDGEIADKLNMARRTVAYQRATSLHELKKLMASED